MTLRVTPVRGARGREVEAADEPGAELTFGRGEDRDLVVTMPDTVAHYFSRDHGRFFFDGKDWRVRRDGHSELLLWFDFGTRPWVTCHGRGADLKLPVTEGTITVRPPNTNSDLVLRWTVTETELPSPGPWRRIITETPPPMLGQPKGSLPSRFIPFLLVLCHRLLLDLDGTTPSLEELALFSSDQLGQSIANETVRKDYLGRLTEILRNHKGTETHRQWENAKKNGKQRVHVDSSVLAADVLRLRVVSCDELINQLRQHSLPNFPNLGFAEGKRG